MSRQLWVPIPEEAPFFHHIYIDKSSQNDHRYMVLGGIVFLSLSLQKLEDEIYNAKPPKGFAALERMASRAK